jgi:CheY-like chemotaxis protein
MPHKKMGEILIEKKLISQDNLDKALEQQKHIKKPIGAILEGMDVVLQEDIAKVLAIQFGFPLLKRFAQYTFSKDVLKLIDPETAISKLVFPLKIDNRILHLAMSNPLDMALQNDLSFKLGMRISPCVSTTTEITNAIKKHYLVEEQDFGTSTLKTILLVSPHKIEAGLIENAITREGLNVIKAESGAEGLKLATQHRPDLIITEMILPKMNGTQFYNALKSHPQHLRTPIIGISAKATAEEESRLLDMGFQDFIAKPINTVRLMARLRKALR